MATQIPQMEIPPQVREMAEKSVDQAKKAFDTFVQQAQKTVTTMESQAATMQSSAKDLNTKAMTFAEANIAASFSFAQKLVRAKDLNQIAALQQEFLQSQMKALSEQAKEIGTVTTKIVTEVTKPRS